MSGKDLTPSQRALLLAAGAVILAFGVAGGVWRLGWEIPLPGTEPASFHGAIMVAAFFGTVIALERAAASSRRLAYLGPACAAAGGLLAALGAPHPLSALLLLAGTVAIAVLAFPGARREPTPHAAMALAGAFCGLLGNGFWLAELPAADAVGAWLAFLVLSIAAERLELSHLRRPGRGVLLLLGAAAALQVAGAALLPFLRPVGAALVGAGLVGTALWLLSCDVARRNLRHHGQMRFTAVALVGGYVWLGIGGALLPFAAQGGALYDAALHAVFLGFVFSMVIGHAPDVAAELFEVEVPYTSLFYLHLALLDATLALRVVGDLAALPALRAWAGLGNAAALALFLAATALSVRRGRRAG